ncbi:MAG TPA: hypothetical protein PKA19_12440, partial [Bacillota bacterium]|nr:hypothetical protein [Bacillota bacterium]
MKKVNLSFMAVMIISLVIILIMNAMAVFAYHDKILSIEIRKDDMLGLSVKYFNLLENMHSNANQYRNTNDEKFRLEFYSLLKSYEETRSFQIDSIRFNEEELRLYNNYLGSFQSLVGILKTAVTDRDYS